MNNRVLILIPCMIFVIFLPILSSCGKSNIKNTDKPTEKYVDINDIVQEENLTETHDGYNCIL